MVFHSGKVAWCGWYVYRQAPVAPLFRGMTSLVLYSPVWWSAWQTAKISLLLLAAVFHSIEAAWCAWRTSPTFTSRSRPFSNLRGPAFQVLILLEGLGLSLCAPFLGKCQWDPKYFCSCRACLCYSSAPGLTLKKALRRICPWQIAKIYWVVNTSSDYQALYFFNVIKISISFPTSDLVISHSVTTES